MAERTAISLNVQRTLTSAGPILRSIRTPADLGAASLYIHVPFCYHKCHYCDFYSIVDTRDRQEAFTHRLIRELDALAPWAARPLETIFVGGGTPSLLRVDLWRMLLSALAERFDLSMLHAGSGEFTVECNPETVTRELMDTLAGGGVTRVSMGAQSFESRHLKTLERWHDPGNVARALEHARAAGIRRQSIDLIFGVPGQSLDDWRSDLATAISLGTEHLSAYSLTYEPNTAMTARLKRGEFSPMDEDIEVDMHRAAWEILRAAGLDRYEVSNFAKPGAECRHNLAYWRQRDWLAAGPSASAHVAGHRWKNVARLDDYLSFDDAGFAPIIDHEPPDAMQAIRERIMTGLRLREGLSMSEIEASLARAAPAVASKSMERLTLIAERARRKGWMHDDATTWRLTDEGILFADAVAAEMMGEV